MTEPRQWQDRADELATDALAAGRPSSWFDPLYAEGVSGATTLAWDTAEPRPVFASWLARSMLNCDGTGRRALVIGCGLGTDAAHVADHGYDTTAFDVSPTAIRLASERHARSGLQFHVADLFDLPEAWLGAFDLVVEIFTVQALPPSVRPETINAVVSTVAPGGTLVVIQAIDEGPEPVPEGPPWPLTREEIESFATDGRLDVVAIDERTSPDAVARYWVAEFRRPSSQP